MAKMGAPLKNLVYDDQGNQIAGLRLDKGTKSYFTPIKDEQGKFKKQTFGRDKEAAIRKYQQWQGKSKTIINYKISPVPPKTLESPEGLYLTKQSINEDFIWAYVSNKLKTDPLYVAQKLKLPALANPELLKDYKPKKSYTLKEIGDNYFNRVNHIHKRELQNTKHSWTKFVSIVKVKTVIELDTKVVRSYFDKLYSEFKKGKSTSWIKNHFEKVKRIFNFAADSFDNAVELIEVKQRLKSVLKAPKSSILYPAKKITKEIFWLIIEASNTEEKAMWFLSLNLAYYGVDLVTLPLDAIDFKNKTILFRRGKTGIHRAGILWKETIEAIKQYQKEKPHRGSTLFLNMQAKIPYSPIRICKKFSNLIKTLEKQEQLKLKENTNYVPVNFDYCHSNFRDSFESVCAAMSIPQRAIDGVMGHTGIAAKYTDVESTPEITTPACQAVHDYYFGNEADPKTKETDKKT